MSSEEHRQDPDTPEHHAPQNVTEPIEEAQGAPEDPNSLEQPEGEQGAVVDAEAEPADAEPADASVEEEVDGAAEEQLAALTGELDAARRERDEYLDALRRLKAEFENARKRQERERARILDTASERLVLELLPVLDNLDRALDAEGDIREGVRATRDQLADALRKEGLLPVASDGQRFDPNVHEAVMGQPSEEHEEGTIIQTFQRGYLLNGKPIRPAKVVVARQV